VWIAWIITPVIIVALMFLFFLAFVLMFNQKVSENIFQHISSASSDIAEDDVLNVSAPFGIYRISVIIFFILALIVWIYTMVAYMSRIELVILVLFTLTCLFLCTFVLGRKWNWGIRQFIQDIQIDILRRTHQNKDRLRRVFRSICFFSCIGMFVTALWLNLGVLSYLLLFVYIFSSIISSWVKRELVPLSLGRACRRHFFVGFSLIVLAVFVMLRGSPPLMTGVMRPLLLAFGLSETGYLFSFALSLGVIYFWVLFSLILLNLGWILFYDFKQSKMVFSFFGMILTLIQGFFMLFFDPFMRLLVGEEGRSLVSEVELSQFIDTTSRMVQLLIFIFICVYILFVLLADFLVDSERERMYIKLMKQLIKVKGLEGKDSLEFQIEHFRASNEMLAQMLAMERNLK